MIAQAWTTVALLVVVSVATKMAADPLSSATTLAARDLLQRALHRRDMAYETTEDPLLRFQHFVTAAATLSAARSLAADRDLERSSGVDVARLARSLDSQMSKSRQSALASAPPTESTSS